MSLFGHSRQRIPEHLWSNCTKTQRGPTLKRHRSVQLRKGQWARPASELEGSTLLGSSRLPYIRHCYSFFCLIIRLQRQHIHSMVVLRNASGVDHTILLAKEKLGRFAKYRIRPSSLEISAELPQRGGKGEVVMASYKRYKKKRKTVAVKKLKLDGKTDKEKFAKEFVHEVGMLEALSHKNIVRLIGFVEDLTHNEAWIVLSWESNGNIKDCLSSGTWEIPERISLIQDTFEGLMYLHTHQPPICHGDLKSLNIIVDASYRAKITDFGSARAMSENVSRDTGRNTSGPSSQKQKVARPGVKVNASSSQLTLSGPARTLRWAAPEVVNQEAQPGLPSDIWSAGWVCWEIMTGKVPFSEVDASRVMWRVAQGRVPSTRKNAQLSQTVNLCSVMEDCWAFNPADRPTISECYDRVKWMPSTRRSSKMSLDPQTPSFDVLFGIGQMHYEQGGFADAIPRFLQALAVGESNGDLNQVAKAREWLGDIDRLQSRYSDAEKCFAIVRDIYARTGNKQGQANTLWGLGDVYRLQCRYPEAVECFTQARDLYVLIEDDRGRANALRGLGDILCTQSEYEEAKKLLKQAQEIYVSIGDEGGRADVLGGLGNVYYANSSFDEAASFYREANAIYARTGDDTGLASTLDELGDIYIAQSDFCEAEKSFTEAQEIYSRISDDQGRANTLRGLGDIHRESSEFKKSANCYTLAQDIYSRIGDRNGLAKVLLSLGHLHRTQGRNSRAAKSYTASRDLYAQIGCPSDEQRATHWLNFVSKK